MKAKYILPALFFLFTFARLSAQTNVEFDEKNFPDKKTLKEAKKHFDNGNDLFKQASEIQDNQLKYFVEKNHYLPNGINELQGAGMDGFKLALAEYLIANNFNPNCALLNYRMAVCYYNIPAQKVMGLSYAEKAVKLVPNVDPMVQYYLGRL